MGTGYIWPFGMENWCNLEGKYLHIVADMSAYTSSAADSDEVSVCSLSIYGTKYVRDDPLPNSIIVIPGKINTFSVPDIYALY